MATDAIMAQVVRLWTATSHTAEQDANKDKQLALYYQNLRNGNWTLKQIGRAFDQLSREAEFWPSWAKVEKALNAERLAIEVDDSPFAILRRGNQITLCVKSVIDEYTKSNGGLSFAQEELIKDQCRKMIFNDGSGSVGLPDLELWDAQRVLQCWPHVMWNYERRKRTA